RRDRRHPRCPRPPERRRNVRRGPVVTGVGLVGAPVERRPPRRLLRRRWPPVQHRRRRRVLRRHGPHLEHRRRRRPLRRCRTHVQRRRRRRDLRRRRPAVEDRRRRRLLRPLTRTAPPPPQSPPGAVPPPPWPDRRAGRAALVPSPGTHPHARGVTPDRAVRPALPCGTV